MEQTVTLAREFELEAYRIDQLIWDAMALRADESVLFCGFANNLEWIKRAVAVGVKVSVISDDNAAISAFEGLPIGIVRGSSTMIPANDGSFDVAVAFHYLHEVDPLFHTNIVAEIARVGKRCVLVEPAPPSDALGLRIAALYARAKRQLGQFEQYHPIEYWRKLMAIAKPEITYQTFAFRRTPPRDAIRDTVSLIIDTMAAEQTPASYIDELRGLAAGSNAQLIPQSRFVIVGTSLPGALALNAGTDFRDRPPEYRSAVKPFVPPMLTKTALPATRVVPTVYNDIDIEPEFPAVLPPIVPAAAPAPAVALQPAAQRGVPDIARNAFGLTATTQPETNRGAGFDTAGEPAPAISDDFGWAWEAPGGASDA